MSILLNFAMFPTDKGRSGVSEYVSKVLKMIADSGVSYKLNPMGTTIETTTMKEALDIVHRAYQILEPLSDRIYTTINIDARKGHKNAMESKIKSVEDKIGSLKH